MQTKLIFGSQISSKDMNRIFERSVNMHEKVFSFFDVFMCSQKTYNFPLPMIVRKMKINAFYYAAKTLTFYLTRISINTRNISRNNRNISSIFLSLSVRNFVGSIGIISTINSITWTAHQVWHYLGGEGGDVSLGVFLVLLGVVAAAVPPLQVVRPGHLAAVHLVLRWKHARAPCSHTTAGSINQAIFKNVFAVMCLMSWR